MSKWFPNPITARIAFYLPSNIKGEKMSAAKRKNLIGATMAFLVHELGGGTEIEATGSFAGSGGEIVQEQVTICYGFLTEKAMKKHSREINQIANALCIEFEQESIALEKDNDFHCSRPTRYMLETIIAIKRSLNRTALSGDIING